MQPQLKRWKTPASVSSGSAPACAEISKGDHQDRGSELPAIADASVFELRRVNTARNIVHHLPSNQTTAAFSNAHLAGNLWWWRVSMLEIGDDGPAEAAPVFPEPDGLTVGGGRMAGRQNTAEDSDCHSEQTCAY